MATIHSTAIAKATLSASLLRADPTPVVGDEISRLHSLLEKCITVCTPENIKIEPFLKALFGQAQDPTRKKQRRRLENLLSIWSSKGYFPESLIASLRSEVTKSFEAGTEHDDTKPLEPTGSKSKEPKALLPALHGDPNAPYHDLPATTMLPLMRPNSPTPISARSVKPISMKAGPPPKGLSDAVEEFVKNVDKMWYGGDMRMLPDVDELGVSMIKSLEVEDEDSLDDPNNGRNMEESYYGWSRGFALKMMERRKGALRNDSEEMAQFFQAGLAPPPPPMGGTAQSWPMAMQFNNMQPAAPGAFSQWPGGQAGVYNQPPPPPPPMGQGGNQQYGRGGYQGRGGWNNRGRGW
ncbi:hypothetical protein ABW19_dt0200689 [Dactylella cylindrospora]|nr:hypothetical protein ABW19_dt0200689 [Dactylella cylindrospora]